MTAEARRGSDGRPGPRVAVVGAGPFGAEHAHAIKAAGGQVCAVVDPDLQRAEALTRNTGGTPFDDVERMLQTCRPDGMTVAATSSAHPRIVTAGVRAGVKVLVEKPVAPTSGAVRDLRTLPGADDLVVPGHVLRFDAAHRAVRAALPGIGAIHAISASRDRDSAHAVRFAHEHPALLTMVHDIDLCLWLSPGGVETVSALGAGHRTPSNSDVLQAQVRTSAGVHWSLRTSWVIPVEGVEHDRLEIFGADGTVELQRDGSTTTVRTLTSDAEPSTAQFAFDPLPVEMAEFVLWLTGAPRPEVTLGDAERGLAVAEAVMRSAAEHGVVQQIR